MSYFKILFAMVFLALFSGLATGAGLGVPLIATLLLFAAGAWLMVAYGLAPFRTGAQGMFWAAITIALVTHMLEMISPVSLSWISDVALIVAAPFALISLPGALKRSSIMYVILALFTFAVALGIVSTFTSSFAHWKAAFYQLAYNAKWPLMLLLGFRVGWSEGGDRVLAKIMAVFALIALLALVFQFAAPGPYYAFFGKHMLEDGHFRNPFLGGALPRGTGPFIISTILALMAALFCCFSWSQATLAPKGRRSKLFVLAGVCFLILILTGQRQETATTLGALGLLAVALKFRRPLPALVIGSIVILLSVVVLGATMGPKLLQVLAEQWGLVPSFAAIDSARPVFTGDSIRLANQYFPLGTGFGTYASNGAKLFNRDLYSYLGYGSYWWYVRDMFLLDTYWPNYIAEIGWVGFVSLFIVPLITCIYTWLKIFEANDPVQKRLRAYAFVGQFIPFGISLTSSLYSNPDMVGFSMMLFGMSVAYQPRLAAPADRSNPLTT